MRQGNLALIPVGDVEHSGGGVLRAIEVLSFIATTSWKQWRGFLGVTTYISVVRALFHQKLNGSSFRHSLPRSKTVDAYRRTGLCMQ